MKLKRLLRLTSFFYEGVMSRVQEIYAVDLFSLWVNATPSVYFPTWRHHKIGLCCVQGHNLMLLSTKRTQTLLLPMTQIVLRSGSETVLHSNTKTVQRQFTFCKHNWTKKWRHIFHWNNMILFALSSIEVSKFVGETWDGCTLLPHCQ